MSVVRTLLRKLQRPIGLFASLPMIITLGCAQEAPDTAGDNAVTGYVLKSGGGEALYDGTWIIKASPNDGTRCRRCRRTRRRSSVPC